MAGGRGYVEEGSAFSIQLCCGPKAALKNIVSFKNFWYLSKVPGLVSSGAGPGVQGCSPSRAVPPPWCLPYPTDTLVFSDSFELQ